ncbi:hypothetical protein M3231_19865 [Neobacillus mesonae]|nr:hypothetical protein [Neobacillus mesonae]
MYEISYRRLTAVKITGASFLFILAGFLLMYALSDEGLGIFESIYYASGMVLSFWFFGPVFIRSVYLIFTNPTLLKLNEMYITARNGTQIFWKDIKKIELHQSSFSKIVQFVPPQYRVHLHDGQFLDLNTYNMLTNNELLHYHKLLQQAWNENKHKTLC